MCLFKFVLDLVVLKVQPENWQNNDTLDLLRSNKCNASLICTLYGPFYISLNLLWIIVLSTLPIALWFFCLGRHLVCLPWIPISHCLIMSKSRAIKILVWNVRDINSQEKWDALRAKITESACQVICLQETKRSFFTLFISESFALSSLVVLLSPHQLGSLVGW